MPIYEVEDPLTGQVLELEGDSPPTEDELEQIFSSNPMQQQAPAKEGFIERVGADLSERGEQLQGVVEGVKSGQLDPFDMAKQGGGIIAGTSRS